MADIKNLLWAIGLSLLVFYAYEMFFLAPDRERTLEQAQQTQQEAEGLATEELGEGPQGAPAPAAEPEPEVPAQRIAIDSPRLEGSLSTRGARIDDLILKDYHDKIGEGAENIHLLNPGNGRGAYYAEFGWAGPPNSGIALPGPQTVWQASGGPLDVGSPVELTWRNGQGLTFRQIFTIDENYLFTVRHVVENASGEPVAIAPYGRIRRVGTPETRGFFILHEGPLGVFDGTLEEVDYDDLQDDGPVQFSTTGGWLGITDKYWLTALIPDQNRQVAARFVHQTQAGADVYQANFIMTGADAVGAGSAAEYTTRLFAGAKEVDLIDTYEKTQGIPLFDRAIDWGWFYFLTRPIFWLLDFFYKYFGNFGVAILLLTVLIKLLFFPLANKSYRAMSKMKKLQPKMMQVRERFPDDKMRQQQEIMALYQKEKVNPAAGCLPILVQIPVFFALYKVLFVTIEMRHQPFFGWIQDLSAPDPVTVITLFGLIPWNVPGWLAWLQIGIWPILMGLTMWLQMQLNPKSPDPIQAKIFTFMPIIFTFILAPFPVGLVIYWTWNNLLSILQQWIIMKKEGVSPGG